MSGVASPIYERRFQRKNGEEFLAEINAKKMPGPISWPGP
jgi:hypothetical protein